MEEFPKIPSNVPTGGCLSGKIGAKQEVLQVLLRP